MKKLLIILIILITTIDGYSQILDVPIRGQETENWCVQASTSALLAYFNIYISQCELKDYQRVSQHWKILKDNCCMNSSRCNERTSSLAGEEGSAEEALALINFEVS